ncbi:hypothetical protein Lal_00049706 [Lupinus albus]|uniref:Uncharacterized protein n=1 Tax=Lupinus albus TaxID=3870 RepID=A0A6A5M284_LUPAL|nr:hypothetical protein Lalb_Chr12g0196861 [Lupinus albus]KAF1867277.1 hypothetical protein Lal_00049706 [Lupinus albus]
MSLLTFRGSFVLVCVVGLLASQPFKVSCLRSKDLALRSNAAQLSFLRSFRILKAVAMKDMQSKLNLAPTTPSTTFDPNNQSNKRTVGKGSDPIHNRC